MASQSVEKLWNISRYAKADDQTRGGSKLTSLTNPLNVGKIKYLTEEALTPRSASDLTVDKAVTGIVFPIGHGTVAGAAADTNPATTSTGTPWWDVGAHTDVTQQLGNVPQNWGYNQIGDPAELSYKLTSDDFVYVDAASISISSITESSGTATATTATDHFLSTGDTVTISGANQSVYNDSFVVTVTGDTTFTFTVASGSGTATGTIIVQGPVQPVEKDGSAQKFVNALLDSAYISYNSGVNQGSGLNSMTVSRGALSLISSSMSGISGITNKYSRSYSVTFNYTQSGIIEAGQTAALPDITNDLVTEASAGPF